MSKQTKITKSARGEDCTVRIPGHCNHNPETVVLAHLNGGGIGMKRKDWEAAYCCSDCHDVIDGRVHSNTETLHMIHIWHMEGVLRTQRILFEKGLLVVT